MPKRPMTYDHLRKNKKPNQRSVRVPMDSEVADEYEAANQEFELAKLLLRADPENMEVAARVKEKEAAYDKAKEKIREASVKFTFRAIGRKAFNALKADHPRTPPQMKEDETEGRAVGEITWNHDTFPQVLVSAASVDPALTPEETAEMWDDPNWSEAELALLFGKAMDANQEYRVVDLGKD